MLITCRSREANIDIFSIYRTISFNEDSLVGEPLHTIDLGRQGGKHVNGGRIWFSHLVMCFSRGWCLYWWGGHIGLYVGLAHSILMNKSF